MSLGLIGLLGACGSQISGTPRVVDSLGPVQLRGTATTARADTLDLRERFQAHANAAALATADAATAGRMVQSGLLLARANCDDFFVNASALQRRTDIGRDMVAPIISVLTNIVALQSLSDDRNDRYLKILSVGSGAALAGISIIDQHFLFGADNVKEVRDLTFQALDTHQQALEGMGAGSFEVGIQQLIDHQVICTPSSILALTKQAIAAGEVVADTTAGASQDDQALAQLATTLNLIGAATPAQATVLWALYQGGVSADAVPGRLEDDLNAVGLSRLIVPSVAEVPATADTAAVEATPARLSEEGRTKAEAVIAILKSFSPSTRAQFAQAAAAADGGRMSLMRSDVILDSGSPRSGRVKLTVR